MKNVLIFIYIILHFCAVKTSNHKFLPEKYINGGNVIDTTFFSPDLKKIKGKTYTDMKSLTDDNVINVFCQGNLDSLLPNLFFLTVQISFSFQMCYN